MVGDTVKAGDTIANLLSDRFIWKKIYNWQKHQTLKLKLNSRSTNKSFVEERRINLFRLKSPAFSQARLDDKIKKF